MIPKIYRRIFRIVDRLLNQKHSYDYPSQNNGWIKSGNSPVIGNRQTGSLFDPYVICCLNKFVMFVSERNHGIILRLTSKDGVEWKDNHVSFKGSTNKWDHIVNRCCVIEHSGIWKMWYTGQYLGKSCIGYCESNDGMSFRRVGEEPVLIPEYEHEGESVMNPCVLWNEENKIFQMWYSAGETYEPDVICYAESKDGINWIKNEKPVLKAEFNHEWEKYKVGGCSVVKCKDDLYRIFYIGYQNLDVARICEAASNDGIVWKRKDNNILLSPSKKSWDSDAVYKPSVVIQKDKMYMWYNGRRGHEEYIGLATKIVK